MCLILHKILWHMTAPYSTALWKPNATFKLMSVPGTICGLQKLKTKWLLPDSVVDSLYHVNHLQTLPLWPSTCHKITKYSVSLLPGQTQYLPNLISNNSPSETWWGIFSVRCMHSSNNWPDNTEHFLKISWNVLDVFLQIVAGKGIMPLWFRHDRVPSKGGIQPF